jgi:phosphoribosyl 1,2-cyclic phosphodiesterase
MLVKFWGVRGSIPCPGPQTVKYGGNTACIELRLHDTNRLIIIDAGSGIRDLGNELMAKEISRGPLKSDIFLTHTHWDHIMGFPFFVPIFIPGTRLNIYGPVTYEDESLKEVLSGQWTYRYFPVRHEELSAKIAYFDLKEEQVDLGQGMKLTTKYLNHPLLCLGYRFEYKGKVFCTAYDTEPFQNVFASDPDDPAYDEAMALEGEQVAREENQRLEAFVANADLLVYDTQYTQAEYEPAKRGWGHSSIEFAIDMARRSKVKRLALFHHDPMRSDEDLDTMIKRFCNHGKVGEMEVFFAREKMSVNMAG